MMMVIASLTSKKTENMKTGKLKLGSTRIRSIEKFWIIRINSRKFIASTRLENVYTIVDYEQTRRLYHFHSNSLVLSLVHTVNSLIITICFIFSD